MWRPDPPRSYGLDKALNSREFWFFTALAIWLVRSLLDITLFAVYLEPFGFRTVIVVVGALLLVGEIRERFGLVDVIGLGAVALVGLVAIKSAHYELALVALFVFCARNIEFAKIARFALKITVAVFIIVVAAASLDIIKDYLWGVGVPGERIRHGLGFRYTTLPTHVFLNIVLLYGFLTRTRASIGVIAGLMAINLAIYSATGSRNSFLLVAFFLVVLLAFKIPFLRRLYGRFLMVATGALSFGGFFVLSFLAAWFYTPRIGAFVKLNSILSNRLAQTNASMHKYGFPLLGQDITFMGNGLNNAGEVVKSKPGDYDLNFIDNSYMLILVNYGLVFTAVVLGAFTLLGLAAARRNDKVLCAILFVIAVHSVIDPQLVDIAYNTFVMLLLAIHVRKDEAHSPPGPPAPITKAAIFPAQPVRTLS